MIACPFTLTLALIALVRWILKRLNPAVGIESMPAVREAIRSALAVPTCDGGATQVLPLPLRSVFRDLDAPDPDPAVTQVLSADDAAWTRYLCDCAGPNDAALLAPLGIRETPDVRTLVGHLTPSESERLDALWGDLVLTEGR